MNQYVFDDLIDRIDEILEMMNNHEELCVVAIEVAHQLRDEVSQIEVDYEEE